MKFAWYILLFFFPVFLIAQDDTLDATFSDYEIKSIDANVLWTAAQSARESVIRLEVDRWKLQLEVAEIIAPDFKSVNDLGQVVTTRAELPVPMKGYTLGGGRASLTIGAYFIQGFIEEDNQTFYIEPLQNYRKNAGQDQFVVYEIGDVKDKGPRECGYTAVQRMKTEQTPQESSRQTGLCYEIDYGIVLDYSMVNKYGTEADAQAHVIAVTNDVNTNYDDEFDDEIIFIMTGIYAITTNGGDPWSASTDPFVLLPSFATWAITNLASAPISIVHDIASLWSNRDFDGTTIGLAYTPGACSSTLKYNILQDFDSDANSLRVLTAHELGHNLDADHDEGTNTFIMSPSVNNTVTWSAASITAIENYYNSVGCFSICAGTTPQVNFDAGSSSVGESGISGTGGPCLDPYIDIVRTVSLTNAPTANATVNVAVDAASTATVGFDFELITTSVSFTPAGALTQDITIRIYDDPIEELEETILLNITTSSMDINLGFVDQHTITISAVGDEVSTTCCSIGPEVTYGGFTFSVSMIFRGGVTDSKSRVLVLASQLTAAGLTSGYIDQMSLYVFVKNSTGPFENFTIGCLGVTENNLDGTPWYTTQEVFNGDVNTVVSSWNDFSFNNLFLWDGTSNLYIDFCFSNSAVIGADNIVGSTSPGTTGVETVNFRESNTNTGCSLNSGAYFFFTDLQPHMRFRQVVGASIATAANSTSGGNLSAGDVAHFYSPSGQVICSIKNLGTTNMGCVDVTINTAGNGQPNLPFGSDQYSAKTIQVDADNAAYYELSLYYTTTELATWGAGAADLNLIQSSGVITSATAVNSEILPTIEVTTGIGAGGGSSYRTSAFGDGYFALTNGVDARIFSELDQADYVIEESGMGVLFKNSTGAQYVLTASAAGVLSTSLNNAASAANAFSNCDLTLPAAGHGLILNGDDPNPTMITVDNDGVITAAVIGALPTTKASLETGHLGLSDNGGAIIFKNAEGECWKVVVDDSGSLITVQVTCGS